ncbi:MAG: hypothetical protein ACTSUE_16285 [Promethearchaeota archaeon]
MNATSEQPKFKPNVDVDVCMGCGLCQDSCNSHEVKACLVLKNGVMCIIDESECMKQQPDCGYRCVKLCPTKAFTLLNTY